MNQLKLVLLLALIFLLCHDGISQTENQVEIYAAPTMCNEFDDQSSSPGLRFDVGASYMRRIHPKASIGTGLSYSSMGSNSNLSYFDYTTQSNEVNSNKYFINYIEVPFKFSGQISKNGNKSILYDINIINQFLISVYNKSNHEVVSKSNFKELKDRNADMYDLAIQIGITYQKRFADNLFFGISPFFKFGITQFPNFWSLGLKVAIGSNF